MLVLCLCYACVMFLLCFCYAFVMLLLCFCYACAWAWACAPANMPQYERLPAQSFGLELEKWTSPNKKQKSGSWLWMESNSKGQASRTQRSRTRHKAPQPRSKPAAKGKAAKGATTCPSTEGCLAISEWKGGRAKPKQKHGTRERAGVRSNSKRERERERQASPKLHIPKAASSTAKQQQPGSKQAARGKRARQHAPVYRGA